MGNKSSSNISSSYPQHDDPAYRKCQELKVGVTKAYDFPDIAFLLSKYFLLRWNVGYKCITKSRNVKKPFKSLEIENCSIGSVVSI